MPTPATDNPFAITSTPVRSHPLTAASVLAAYRRMAPVYNWLFGACYQAGQRRAVAALDSRAGDRILDVGVGTGTALRHWHPRAEVHGIDLSPHMLAHAERERRRRRLSGVRLSVMDAQATTYPDSHFDKVAAMYVVSVVPNPGALLREMRRVCKPGGRIAIVNHFEHENGLLRRLERALAEYAGLLGFNAALPLAHVTDAPGLRICRIESVNWGGYWTLIEAQNLK